MPATTQSSSTFPRSLKILRQTIVRPRSVLWLIALIAAVALVAWGRSAWVAGQSQSAATTNAPEPVLTLALGTVRLEGTDQAIDAASAAKLLPLWQLLAEVNDSGSASPQEITAVVEEIRLNMTADQIQEIDAISISTLENSPSASASAGSTTVTGGAQAELGGSPGMGVDMLAGGPPPGGGGPMRSSGSQQSTTTGSTVSTSPTQAAIQEVIQLLERKIQG